jgi:hypothetical protein
MDYLGRSFGTVVVLIVLLYLMGEGYGGSRLGDVATWAIAFATILVTLRAVGSKQRLVAGIAVTLTAALTLAAVGRLVVDVRSLGVPADALAYLGLLIAPFLTLRWALTRRRVDLEVVLAAVAVYLFIGIFFAGIYQFAARIDPTFFDPAQYEAYGEWSIFYYSFTVLTTLGFGDITPVPDWLQGITVLEALIGQVYLVVLVARLVALHIRDWRVEPVREDPTPSAPTRPD